MLCPWQKQATSTGFSARAEAVSFICSTSRCSLARLGSACAAQSIWGLASGPLETSPSASHAYSRGRHYRQDSGEPRETPHVAGESLQIRPEDRLSLVVLLLFGKQPTESVTHWLHPAPWFIVAANRTTATDQPPTSPSSHSPAHARPIESAQRPEGRTRAQRELKAH